MSFFSHYPSPDSIVHSFSQNWKETVSSAPSRAEFLVPNKSIVQDIVSKRTDLIVRSWHELISKKITTSTPSQRCFWIQDISHISNCTRLSLTSSTRHSCADVHGVWWQDFWIDERRRFGIEIELTADDFISTSSWKKKEWKGRAGIILAFLNEALGAKRVFSQLQYTSKPIYDQWQVVYDESAGWEIVSPILCGREGVDEVMTVMNLISELRSFGFTMRGNTGLHIHLSWDESVQRTKNLLHWWRFFEPSIATLLHPSRVFSHHKGYFSKTSSNGFCVPLSQSTDGQYIQEAEDISEICLDVARYTAVNPHSILQKKSVEFRMFKATDDPILALMWLSLCQQIAYIACDNKIDCPMTADWDSSALTPTGDIVLLCQTYLPAGSHPSFLNVLINRRRQIAAHWCRNASLHQWLPFIRSWKTTYTQSVSTSSVS